MTSFINWYSVSPEGNQTAPEDYELSSSYPAQSLVVVLFSDKNGKTLVNLEHFVNDDFPEREEMIKGWTQMFEHLSGVSEKAIVFNNLK